MSLRGVFKACVLSFALNGAILSQGTKEQVAEDQLQWAQKLYENHDYAAAARVVN